MLRISASIHLYWIEAIYVKIEVIYQNIPINAIGNFKPLYQNLVFERVGGGTNIETSPLENGRRQDHPRCSPTGWFSQDVPYES